MTRFNATIKGLSPGLLQNKMGINELMSLRDKTRKVSKHASRPSLEDEAAMHVHLNADKQACIPKSMLMSCLIGAGKFIRLDQKRQLSTKDSSLLPGFLVLEGENYPLLMPGSKDESKWGFSTWKHDIQQGRNPNGGEAVCIVRPLFEKWGISLTLLADLEQLPEDTYLKLFEYAGRRVGLGDFRPARKGTFGMFTLTRWENIGEDSMSSPSFKKAAA